MRDRKEIGAEALLGQLVKFKRPRSMPEDKHPPEQPAGLGYPREDRAGKNDAAQPYGRQERDQQPGIARLARAQLRDDRDGENEDQRQCEGASTQRPAQVDQRLGIIEAAGVHHHQNGKGEKKREHKPLTAAGARVGGIQQSDPETERKAEDEGFRKTQYGSGDRHEVAEYPNHAKPNPHRGAVLPTPTAERTPL